MPCPAPSMLIHADRGASPSRTRGRLPLDLAAPPPPSITCAQLGAIKAPTAVVRGELTPPFFRIIADTANRCIPGSLLIVVPNTRHLWPAQEPAAFNQTLLEFLAKN